MKKRVIEEIFAEKLRAMVQRCRPRDLYDIVHLHNDARWKPARQKINDTLKIKCKYKDVPVPTMEILDNSNMKPEAKSDWENMLSHQIADLAPFDTYWEQLPHVFLWLEGR